MLSWSLILGSALLLLCAYTSHAQLAPGALLPNEVPDGDFELCSGNGAAPHPSYWITDSHSTPSANYSILCSNENAFLGNYSAKFPALPPRANYVLRLATRPFDILVASSETNVTFWLSPVNVTASWQPNQPYQAHWVIAAQIALMYTYNGQNYTVVADLRDTPARNGTVNTNYGYNGLWWQYSLRLANITQPGPIESVAIIFQQDANILPENSVPFYLDTIQIVGSSVIGDPIFTGFHGQKYQVHGLADRHFNLITHKNTQINAEFIFLGEGDAMTNDEMVALRHSREAKAGSNPMYQIKQATTIQVPNTAAWTHEGTFLGSLAMKFHLLDGTVSRVRVISGEYGTGIRAVQVNGMDIALEHYPVSLVQSGPVRVVLKTTHTLVVSTSEMSFVVVNSDGFFNIEQVVVSTEIARRPSLIDGVLGQSADPKRYFPNYVEGADASAEVRSDWQKHQIMDYLIADENPFSDEFVLNKFVQ